MTPIPLPSHVHYELLLQLLERKALSAASEDPVVREKVQQLIVTLRKALAQQKQLERICEQSHFPYEHRWSINSSNALENNQSLD
ncbi:MAG: DUF5340 domain-containing protein [Microcystaceae cyanobacterium]